MKYLKIIVILISAPFLNQVYAASTLNASGTKNAPQVQVRSSTILAQKNATTKYVGNVEIAKGMFVIKADTAILQNKKGIYQISGKPATFIDMASDKDQVSASAQTMNFDEKANKIVLKGNASIIKNGKKEQGKQLIIYDLTTHNYKF